MEELSYTESGKKKFSILRCFFLSGLVDPGFESRQRKGIFLSSETFKSTLRPTQPPIQWIRGSFHGMKAAGTCIAEVKDEWNSKPTSAPRICMASWHAEGKLYLYFLRLLAE